MHNGEDIDIAVHSKFAQVGAYVCALARCVSYRQSIAVCKTSYGVRSLAIFGSGDIRACTGNGIRERIACVLLTIVYILNIVDHYADRCRSYGQSAEGCCNLIVGGLVFTPIDLIGVFAAAELGLRSGNCKCNGLASAKSYFSGCCCSGLSPCTTNVCGPVAMVQSSIIGLGKCRTIVSLGSCTSLNSDWQRIDLQETITCIQCDHVVRICHHADAIDFNTGKYCFLLSSGNSISTGILFRDKSTIRTCQSIPDSIAVLFFEQSALSACYLNITLVSINIIKLRLIWVGETNFEFLSGVIVRSTGASGVCVPLVGRNADVNAYRLYRKGARYVNNAVIRFRISYSLVTLGYLRVLRCCCAGARIGLSSVKLD